MPGIKRKASRASPYEPVSKLTKQRTSTTVKPVREKSTMAYEDEVRGRHGGGAINKDLEGLFGTLTDDTDPPGLTLKQVPSKSLFETKTGIQKARLKAAVKAEIKGSEKTKRKAKKKSIGGNTSTMFHLVKINISKKFLRENVSDRDFKFSNDDGCEDPLLNDMNWTDWKRAIYPVKTKLHSPLPTSFRFIKRIFRGANGYVMADLFDWKHNIMAIYELGVRPPATNRIYATLFTSSKGFMNHERWDSVLLKNKRVFQAVSSVVARGGQIFVRRAVYPPGNNIWFPYTIKRIDEIFDYAWNRPDLVGENFRTIEKDSFLIRGIEMLPKTPKKKTTIKNTVISKGKRASKMAKTDDVMKSKTKTKTTKAAAKKAQPTEKTKTPTKKVKPTEKTKTPTKKAKPTEKTKTPTEKAKPTEKTKTPTKKAKPTEKTKTPTEKAKPSKETKASAKKNG
ncbi:uncharacterized protein LOC124127628 [Haliotis rufescens]|uniref:uncharacterized protein LOC124127628 n=1 Tax=Haliotis rufescens TaxID=6454 RepID=UPI00201EF098|nr:uncharacterized protein LOC124127628 [Haliotis rufescens]